MPRIPTKTAAAREAYIYGLFLKNPNLKVKDAVEKLVAHKRLGGSKMAVATVYEIRNFAKEGAGLPPKKKGDEFFGGYTGTLFQSAADAQASQVSA